jgi:hypothetical protein
MPNWAATIGLYSSLKTIVEPYYSSIQEEIYRIHIIFPIITTTTAAKRNTAARISGPNISWKIFDDSIKTITSDSVSSSE